MPIGARGPLNRATARMLPAEILETEVLAGLPAEPLAERGQDRGASGARPAVDERPAAGALEPGDLIVEGGLPDAECLGRREDAGVARDDQQPAPRSTAT
jgi:hypothetical protein